MVLLHRPKLLLLDEPTAGLAEDLASKTCKIIEKVRGALGASIVFVEHRIELVKPSASRTIALRLGQIRTPSEAKEGHTQIV
jgi:ABC-type branched-subunit amino acid transport system ATPase component